MTIIPSFANDMAMKAILKLRGATGDKKCEAAAPGDTPWSGRRVHSMRMNHIDTKKYLYQCPTFTNRHSELFVQEFCYPSKSILCSIRVMSECDLAGKSQNQI